MKNYLHFSTRIENFLFKGFNITTDAGFVGLFVAVSCLGVVAYALLEVVVNNDFKRILLLTVIRNRRSDVKYLSRHSIQVAVNEERDLSVLESLAVKRASRSSPVLGNLFTKKLKHMFCLTLFLFTDLLLMAIAMTYNIFLIIAMLLGCNIGHYTFSKLSEENMPPLESTSIDDKLTTVNIIKNDNKRNVGEEDQEPLDIS